MGQHLGLEADSVALCVRSAFTVPGRRLVLIKRDQRQRVQISTGDLHLGSCARVFEFGIVPRAWKRTED